MCDERERLIGYVYDEVDEEERRRVQGHLESCEVCREEVDGLRRVRGDLLAWDVPEHGSVWKPFAPARSRPWWREVPGWALAAAASLTFIVGAAGGAATQAFLTSPDQVAPASPGARQATPVSLSDAQVQEIERRLLRSMRADLQTELAAFAADRMPAPTRNVTYVTRSDMEAADNNVQQRLFELYFNMNNDFSDALTRIETIEGKQRALALNGSLGPGHN